MFYNEINKLTVNIMKKTFYLFPLLTLVLTGCGTSNNPSLPSESESESESISEYVDPRPDEFLETHLYEESMNTLGEFTPTLFDESSLTQTENTTLSDGVTLIEYNFSLNNGRNVIATTIEVDLTKADARTHYSPGAADVLYTQMTNFQQINTDVDVIAGINADFFGRGGTCVNAYVKDYTVIKSAHNNNGIYDYTNLNADIPASMPMLLGVTGEYARIAPIVENKSVEETIKSSINLKIKYASSDKIVHDLAADLALKVQNGTNKLVSDYTLITEPVRLGVAPSVGDICYVLEMEEGDYRITHGKVSERWECDGNRVFTDDCADGYAYLFKKAGVEEVIGVDDYVGYVLGNDDGKFDGYGNIIGGRQSLVENGHIASTVTLENSNGAQTTNVPRSAVGIKDDGKLLICAVEALRYGGTSSSDTDGYGLNLPQLAEFLREIGCYDAMNFDGGGSTSLITRNLTNESDYSVTVRSSDYGTYNLNQSRKIYNCLLVTTKK